MKLLKTVNLHLGYVPRCLRNQMQKKAEHKLISKIIGIQADTFRIKMWGNGSFIIVWQSR